jgi:threonine/homoserine/homoserine lactone efflux protein
VLGQNPLDYFLIRAGAVLFVMGLVFFFDTPQVGYAGGFFLLWTGLRRWREGREVAAFNRLERPVDTLDDRGFR